MPISNSYSLQRKMEKKKGLFERTHTIGLLLKIAFLLSLFGIVWNLWMTFLTAAILISDIFLTVYRGKILYTYRYEYSDGTFRIVKIDLDGEERVIENLCVKNLSEVEFITPERADKRYYADHDDFGDDRPLKICGEGREFFILSDDYMFSILRFIMQEKI